MNKKQVKTKEDLEEYYNKCRKIKFAEETPKPKNTLQIIKRVLGYEGDSEKTVFTKGGHNCYCNKYRSLDDVIKIVKYYYPKKKIKDIIKTILKYQKSFDYNFYFGYCPNIRKTNFRGKSWFENGSFGKNYFRSSFRFQGFPKCRVNVEDYID